MKIIYILVTLCLLINNSNSESFFDGNFKLAYEIDEINAEMEIRVLMPIQLKWLVAGFHNIPYLYKPEEDLFQIEIKEENDKIKPTLQTCQLRSNDILNCNKKHILYNFEKKAMFQDEWFYFIIKRSTEGLQYGKPVSFIWAFNNEPLNHVGNEPLKLIDNLHFLIVNLELENLFILNNTDIQPKDAKTTSIFQGTQTTSIFYDTKTTSNFDETSTTLILNEEPTNSIFHDAPTTTTNNLFDDQGIIKANQETLNFDDSNNLNKSMVNNNLNKSIANNSEIDSEENYFPSGESCNCSFCSCSSISLWLSVFRAKQNSIYLGIIGASALLTGLIVLFVICSCSMKSIKERKKVAFHEIEELESDEEGDEVYFIKH